MTTFTIRDLYNENKKEVVADGNPFLGHIHQLDGLPFMVEYLADSPAGDSTTKNYDFIDRAFVKQAGKFAPTTNADDLDTEDVETVLNEFKTDVFGLLVMYRDKYQHLYDLAKMEYNPIENYNMVEKGDDTSEGTGSTTSNAGNTSDTYTNGPRRQTTDYGESKNTTAYGNVNQTDVNGNVSTTTNNRVAGYNTDAMSDATQATEATTAQTNTHAEDAHTDTETVGARCDVVNNAESTDTVKREQTKDATSSSTDNRAVKHNLTRSGNIGVTTTQQMAEQELNLWNGFNFYQSIFDDILEKLCNRYDAGYDCFMTPLANVYFGGE